MSTKAIRETLKQFEALAKSHRLGVSVEQGAAIRAARAEVEAIEQAAREVVCEKALEDWNTAQPVALREGIQVIQAIAEQD